VEVCPISRHLTTVSRHQQYSNGRLDLQSAARFVSSAAITYQLASDSIPPRNGWHERSTGGSNEGEGTARGCRTAVDKHFTFSFLYDSIWLTIIIFTTSHIRAKSESNPSTGNRPSTTSTRSFLLQITQLLRLGQPLRSPRALLDLFTV
jgi:hypothetical protein